MVVNRYQLLRSINPAMELVAEMMLPANVSYLSPTTPMPGVNHKYLHLLSPAYISGCGEGAACTSACMMLSPQRLCSCSGLSLVQCGNMRHLGWEAAPPT